MGSPEDPTTVVDSHGACSVSTGLYVADASVFPEVPRANTNLPTMVAAERLAELIPVAAGERAKQSAGCRDA
jgi:choline dehydrogenase/5-(hydroxymethyl)furfural/furfural oxidase